MLLFRRLFGRSRPPGTRLPPSVPGASITGHHEMHKYDFFCTAAMKWARQYGPVYRLRQNFASIVILNNFDSIKKFYSRKEFLNRSRFWVMKSDRYEGLATMNGTIWNLNRRFCLHALRDFGMGKSYAMEDIVIQREIDEVIGRERPPKWEDRLHMPFTMASVWEMDRWKTSTPLGVPREASEDTIVDDFFIPKGTVIMANFWAAHFDVNFWKDPEKFDPTRFLNDDGTLMTRKPECLLPFSFGKRTCPGEILATVEIFLAVTSLLQRFHVLPAGKLPFDINSPSILAGHVQRLKLRFIDRNQGL
ncbi:hypothetical protein MRX96_057070 [Rhipicephalus microplus]